MKRCLHIVFVMLFALLNANVFAQTIDKLEIRAEDTFYEEDFANALPIYQQILEINPQHRMAGYKSEICYILSCCPKRSLDKILSYQEYFSKKDKFYYYWLGRIYLEKYKFSQAIASFEKFLDLKAYKSSIIEEETNKFLEFARHAESFFNRRDEYEIHKMGPNINTEFDELSPVYLKETNELLFTSDRDAESKNREFGVYHAVYNNDEWQSPTPVVALGKFRRDLANIEIIADNKKLYVYGHPKGQDLFESHPDGHASWTKPDEFDPKISHIHLKSNFYISSDEEHIIFTSAKDYKTKGLELYESWKHPTTGKWSKPQPLPPTVNSINDEDSPWISPDGKTLYFSSDGHNSLGNFDVFKSTFDTVSNTWTAPINLGYPINTPGDEMSFKINEDGISGYFSSDRYGTEGKHDIFFFWNTSDVTVKGVIADQQGTPLAGLVVKFIPEGHKNEEFLDVTDEKGEYEITTISDEFIDVEISKDGTILHYDTFQIDPTGGIKSSLNTNFSIDPLKIPEKRIEDIDDDEPIAIEDEDVPIDFLANKFRKGNKSLIRNIYFDYASAVIKDESEPILLRILHLMNSNPTLEIEIHGHTDNLGSKKTNQELSEQRALAVGRWLVSNGVAASRLSTKGFGESVPLASNDDEKMGRELNRRIEIVVVE